MKLFECQNCRQPLYFKNTRCESCGLALGYLPGRETVTALTDDNGVWRALAEQGRRYRYCLNAEHGVSNWLARADPAGVYFATCPAQRTHPHPSLPEKL